MSYAQKLHNLLHSTAHCVMRTCQALGLGFRVTDDACRNMSAEVQSTSSIVHVCCSSTSKSDCTQMLEISAADEWLSDYR